MRSADAVVRLPSSCFLQWSGSAKMKDALSIWLVHYGKTLKARHPGAGTASGSNAAILEIANILREGQDRLVKVMKEEREELKGAVTEAFSALEAQAGLHGYELCGKHSSWRGKLLCPLLLTVLANSKPLLIPRLVFAQYVGACGRATRCLQTCPSQCAAILRGGILSQAPKQQLCVLDQALLLCSATATVNCAVPAQRAS